ncbi:MAG: hypothetical protein K0B52_04555 [FCB group bacterium]|nr:hypothetical protein [FCB group bacterium]
MEQNKTNQLLQKNRRIAETGVFLALFLGLAYAFCYIPNLEFASAIAFLAGLLLGWKRGLFVALIGEGIFSIANPFGSSLAFPTLLLAQLLGFALIALSGSLCRFFIPKLVEEKPLAAAILLGACGLLLSLFYNIITTVFYAVPSGFDPEQILALIISGVPFYLIHLISNTLIFSLLITLIVRYVNAHYPHYFGNMS